MLSSGWIVRLAPRWPGPWLLFRFGLQEYSGCVWFYKYFFPGIYQEPRLMLQFQYETSQVIQMHPTRSYYWIDGVVSIHAANFMGFKRIIFPFQGSLLYVVEVWTFQRLIGFRYEICNAMTCLPSLCIDWTFPHLCPIVFEKLQGCDINVGNLTQKLHSIHA